MSSTYLAQDLYEAIGDVRLRAFNIMDFESAEAYALYILLNGTEVQTNALLKYIGLHSCLALPELKRTDGTTPESAERFISREIDRLCEFFGVDFRGNKNVYVQSLLDNYGGLTYLDFSEFFSRCKQKVYANDFQSISSRGINAEFLNSWLDAFLEDRESYLRMLSRECQENTLAAPTGQVSQRIAEARRHADALRDRERQLLANVSAWKERHEQKYWTYDTGQRQPIRAQNYYRFYEFIALNVYCGSEKNGEAKDFLNHIVSKIKDSVLDVDPARAEMIDAKIKSILTEAQRTVSTLGVYGILMHSLRTEAQRHETPQHMHLALFNKDIGPTGASESAWLHYFAKVAGILIDGWRRAYTEAMERALAVGGHVFTLKEYLAFCAFCWIEKSGLVSPLALFFDELNK